MQLPSQKAVTLPPIPLDLAVAVLIVMASIFVLAAIGLWLEQNMPAIRHRLAIWREGDHGRALLRKPEGR